MEALCISEHRGCEAGAGPDQEQAHGGGGEQRGQEARPQRDGGAAEKTGRSLVRTGFCYNCSYILRGNNK